MVEAGHLRTLRAIRGVGAPDAMKQCEMIESMAGASDTVVRFGPFELDLLRRELRTSAGPVRLGARAFDTLAELVRCHGQTVERAALMQAVWPGRIVEENNLTQAIAALRRALAREPGMAGCILTVAGRGYRFVAPLQHARSGCRYAVAVMPLRCIGDACTAPADLADALVAALSTRTKSPVRSLAAAAALPSDLDGAEAGRRLAATHVVEGSVHAAGSRARVHLRIIETHSGIACWSQAFEHVDGTSVDIIAEALSRALPAESTVPPALPLERRRRGSSVETHTA